MLEFLSAALAKLSALGVAAKGIAVVGVAAATVAAAGAGGVLPTLPSAGDDSAVEQVTRVSDDATDASATDATDATDDSAKDAKDAKDDSATETDATDDTTDDTTKDDTTKDDTSKGEPAPQASFGQGVAEDARKGGVNGQDISELARARNEVRRDKAGAAELPEQASTSTDRATAGSENRNAGREKAADAPVEDAPAGTPAKDRVPARR